MKRIMAELFGHRDGYCQGKGGTQHMASVEVGFIGSNGITGGGIPIATGMALTMKMRHTNNLTVCFFGDGASNQGTFHESLNLASIWKLPVIYILENNQYAFSSPVQEMINLKRLADRATGYGIPGKQLPGNDVVAMASEMAEIADYVRQGYGPVLVEAVTYRVPGHSRNDRCHYRSREEEARWKAKCPITYLYRQLEQAGVLSQTDFSAMEAAVAAEVAEAVEYASQSTTLSWEETLAGVFAAPAPLDPIVL
jgi:pyruvate dehydrogenase E1 component alpha subunit